MITKFEKYNESIKSLLVGPTEEEVWKNLGYGDGFDTPEEFLIYLIKDITDMETNGEVYKIKNNKILFQHNKKHKILYVNYDMLWRILQDIFKMTRGQILNFINDMVQKHFNWIDFKLSIHELPKYDIYNESIKSLLVGPTKEEMWKNLGYDRTFDTPEEFFLYLTDGVEVTSPNGLYYEWKKNGKILFEQYIWPEKIIFMKYSVIKVFDKIFNMEFMEVSGFREFNIFMKEMFNKYFKDYINMNEYQIRIEYGK